MLLHTFQHLQGIGPTRERALWAAGCTTWQRLLDSKDCISKILPGEWARQARDGIAADLAALQTNRLDILAKRLPSRLHWRLVSHFWDRVGTLDIETTGLSRDRDRITLVGLWSAAGARVLVRGTDLDELQSELDRIGILVTFHGAAFDLPFLRTSVPGLVLPQVHVDLRHLAAATGLRGGLKVLERLLGIERGPHLAEVDGREAIRLWDRWVRAGDWAALERLIAYNLADVLNLRPLLAVCINRLLAQVPELAVDPLPVPGSWIGPVRVGIRKSLNPLKA